MTNVNEKNFHSLTKFSGLGICIFYGIDLWINLAWVLPTMWRTVPQLNSIFDLSSLALKTVSDLLFFIGGLDLMRRKTSGLVLMFRAAVLNILSILIIKLFILGNNIAQGILPNVPFFLLTLTQALIWPAFVMWVVNLEELRKHFRDNA